MFGLAIAKLEKPVTLEDAPRYYQDESLNELPWPGGLVGGMISGNGDAPSFRGKAYAHYVEAVTGHSLYEPCEDELWTGDKLKEIAAKLRSAVINGAGKRYGEVDDPYHFDPPEPAEREALAKWFELCVEHNLAVGGDY